MITIHYYTYYNYCIKQLASDLTVIKVSSKGEDTSKCAADRARGGFCCGNIQSITEHKTSTATKAWPISIDVNKKHGDINS